MRAILSNEPRIGWLRALLFACCLGIAAGCGGDRSEPPQNQPQDPPGDPGDGSGGGPGEEPGDEEPDPPVLELQRGWSRQGLAETHAIAVGDFVGDGSLQYAVGGRRPALLAKGSQEPLWWADWLPEDDNILRNGDNDWVYMLSAIPAGDGRSNLLVTDSLGQGALLDGRSGERIWIRSLNVEFPFTSHLLFGPADAPLFFPSYGYAVYDAATGEEAWTVPVPTYATFATASRRGPGAAKGIYVATEIDFEIGAAAAPGASKRKPDPAVLLSLNAQGETLYSTTLPEEEQPMVLAAADLDGQGIDSAVIGFFLGSLRAFDNDGGIRWEKRFPLFGGDDSRTMYDAILAADPEQTGVDSLFVLARDGSGATEGAIHSTLLALSPAGEELWRHPIDRHVRSASIMDVNDQTLLVISCGSYSRVDAGDVLLVRLDDSLDPIERVKLQRSTPEQTSVVAKLPGVDGDELLVGGVDGNLRVVDGRTGEESFRHYLTSWITALETYPRDDGLDWIVYGDDFGNLAMTDAAGELRWRRSLSVGITGWLTSLAVGDLDGSGELFVVAAGQAIAFDKRGTVETFTAGGTALMRAATEGPALDVGIADLDGDGRSEILVAEGIRGVDDCSLLALDSAGGHSLWATKISACDGAELSILPGDEGQRPLIAFRAEPSISHGTPPFVALVESTGEVRWQVEEAMERSVWIRATAAGILSGGVTLGNEGFVTLRELETGRILWTTFFDHVPDPLFPLYPVPSTSAASALVADLDGDGIQELATSTASNQLLLLDGATGAIRWSLTTESVDTEYNQRHEGGPIAFVPASETSPPYLVMGQSHFSLRPRASAFAITMEGAIAGALPLAGPTVGIAVVRRGEAPPAFVVGAGLGLYAAKVESSPLP